MLDPVLFDLALLFGLCAAVAVLFHRLRLPALVGFLAVGALLGPHSLGLVQEQELVQSLAELGVVLLLFTVGLELSWKQMLRLRRAVVVGGGLQVCATVALGALCAHVAGLAWGPALFLGFLLTHSSTTAVTRLLGERRELNAPAGRLAVAIAIGQDIAVVPMILVLPLLGMGTESGSPWLGIGKALLSLVAIGACAHVAAPRILRSAARTRSREVFLLAVVAVFLLVAIVTAACGMSLALGAFLAGLVLSESEHHYQVRGEIEPLRDVLASLFFVSIGMLFDPAVLVAEPGLVALALLAVVVGKTLVVLPIARLLGYPGSIAARSALLLAQVGEFSFVLLLLAHGKQVLPEAVERIFLVVAALSIAATPALFALGRVVGARRRGEERPREKDEDLADHAILVGYGTTGQALGKALAAERIPFVAIDVHAELLAKAHANGVSLLIGDATRPQIYEAAGLRRARVVVLAIDDGEATRRTAALLKRMTPDVRLIVRTGFLSEAAALLDLGVRQVVPMELEASVEVLVRVLRCYLVPDDATGRQVKELRRNAFGIDKLARPARLDGEVLAELLPEAALEVVRIEASSELDGKTLGEAGLPARTGCSVVACSRASETLIAPGATTLLRRGHVVVLLGPSERIDSAVELTRAPLPQPV